MRNPPFIVEYELTTRCNFNCKHCYCEAGKPHPNELSFEEIKELIIDLKEMKVWALDLVGGEPLLHPRILDILSFGKEVGQRLMINTNGSLATKDMVSKIRKVNPNVLIGVSLEGPDPETNDYVRGKGNFERAVQGIRNLINEGFQVTILHVINRRNWKKFEKMVKFALEIGASAVYVDRFIPVGRGAIYAKELDMEPNEWKLAIEHVLNVVNSYKDEIIFYVEESISGDLCSAGINHASILVDGTAVPCGHFRYKKEYYMGNIRERKFFEIWNDYKPLPSPSSCSHCPLLDKCGGGCKAYYLLKNYEKDEAICAVNKGRYNIK
ncbi:radical SAM protein [Thermotoga sp. KOL6]|uniref:radical SAM/SPASM domain-containing protein n=1 Tax=Thermotoga sp. KOL6 TaxID=126741 RepID=UPI000C77F347|nr:radical SAM protein [Thermotoga sp. KOL6]PLV58311.1 radical SAM protein [Thermotoga sp. KOL6]